MRGETARRYCDFVETAMRLWPWACLTLGGVILGCGYAEHSSAEPDAGRPLDGDHLDAARDAAAPVDSFVDSHPSVPPAAPPWAPSFPIAGTGWRDSSEPLCSPYAGRFWGRGIDVWADERGVFAIVSNYNSSFRLDPPYEDGTSVQLNDGSGWAALHEEPAEPGSGGASRLTGVADGPVFAWPGACPLRRIGVGAEASCLYAERTDLVDASMVTEASGWLLVGRELHWLDSSGSVRVANLDDSSDSVAVMGDSDGAIAVTGGSVYSVTRLGELHVLTTAGDEDRFTALWAESTSAFWVGTFTGQILQYDGGTFTSRDTDTSGPVIDLWYDGATLYFATPREFGRLSEATSEVLLETALSDSTVLASIHGQASTGEVYLGFNDLELQRYACGAGILVWFDGSRFHRF